MYRSMIIGESKKIKSIPLKHILIFVGLVVCAKSSASFVRGKSSAFFVRGGLIFRFGFMKIFHNMNKNHVYRKPETVEENREPQLEPEKLEKENNNNMYKIVCIIDGHYIVQTPEGLKKPKVLNLVLNLFQYKFRSY